MHRIGARHWLGGRPPGWAVISNGLTRPRRPVQSRVRPTTVIEHRLACALLGLSTGLLVLAAVVPQQGVTPPIEYGRWREQLAPLSLWLEAAGFTAATRGPWLLLAGLLVGAGLALYGVRRMGKVRAYAHARMVSPILVARIGSLIFHAALLAVGAALALSGLTRFAGHAELAAGAGVVDRPESYLAVQSGPWPSAATGLTVRLDRLVLSPWPDGSLKEQRATVSLLRDGRMIHRQELRRGQTLDAGGISVLLGARTGPAVLLTVADGLGQRSGWVHLPDWPGEGESEVSLAIPGTTARAALALSGARPQQLQDAVLILRPVDPIGRVASWQIRPGETAVLGSARLTFSAVDAWSAVTVTRDPFATWAFIAAGLGLIGLALATVLSTTGRCVR